MTTCASCGHDNGDVARFCESCGSVLSGGSEERRKVVSVLFCDVVGSTALGESTDPEALRALLARYFERMSGIVESHGGSVEKFIGDAVMAVFGVPVVHEDDALRACRAAVEMREAFPELGIEGRIGVATGEVVTGTAERLATGDALNVAARLQQAAQPGEVLVAEATLRLAAEAVDVEPVQPLFLKGKSEPVSAFRLRAARAAAERRHDTAFVGRERELALVSEAWGRVVAEQRCELVTAVGDPGIGKSRLASEALGSIEARVVRGRCPPYGAGITYWPVVEVVRQLDVLPSDPAAAAAIRSLLGESEAGTSAEEIAWAFRKLLEEQAPLVVVFDDIQWGEETFLDLIEHVALLSSGAPLLLFCCARPELLESRPTWPVTVWLKPLGDEDTARLIGGEAVPGELAARIATAAAGNPLFISEMLAMTQETGGEVEVPTSLKALLAARVDRLDPSERRVLERGAVEGEVFHRGAVQALTPEEPHVTPRLAALVRRELIRSDRPQLPGEDGFRFRHLLIRDTAYDALPKTTRAELHERFAAWIGERGAGVVESDEIVGYHLERAYRYRAELGLADAATSSLGERAADRLASAGEKAAARGDMRAATRLLSRAAALYPSRDPRWLSLQPSLGRALHDAGQWDRATAVLSEAVDVALASGDRKVAADANVALVHLRLFTHSTTTHDEARAQLESSICVFEEFGDEAGLARALGIDGQLRFWAGHAASAIGKLERAAQHAHRAGDRSQETQSLQYVLLAGTNGPMPVDEALQRCEQMRGRADGNPRLEVAILRCQARLEAMRGNFEIARELIGSAVALTDELGLPILAAGAQLGVAEIEILAGQAAEAERALRSGIATLEGIGNKGHLVTLAAVLADLLLGQGRRDEAASVVELVADSAMADDMDPQIGWRRVKAKLLAQRGDFEDAERLAHEAIELAEATDYLPVHAVALRDFAEVLRLAGRPEEALAQLEHATRLNEQKGDLTSTAKTRALLESLRRSTATRL